MQTRIQGTTMPVLDVQLDPNESVFSESGELSWMTGFDPDDDAYADGRGRRVVRRAEARGRRRQHLHDRVPRLCSIPAKCRLRPRYRGTLCPSQVGQGQEYLVHRHGFLCATPQVTISVGFQQSLGAGIFGGDGFLLQKVGGNGYGVA